MKCVVLSLAVSAICTLLPPYAAALTPLESAEVSGSRSPSRLYINIRTDKVVYKNNEAVTISGRIYGSEGGSQVKGEHLVQILANPFFEAPTFGGLPPRVKAGDAQIKGRTSPDVKMPPQYINLIAKDGAFTTNELVMQVPEYDKWYGYRGRYNITATVTALQDPAAPIFGMNTKTILVQEIGWNKIILALGLPMLLALVIPLSIVLVMSMTPTKKAATAALWCVYLFGLFSLAVTLGLQPIFSLSPGAEAFLRTTPVALAKTTTDQMDSLHWLIEIGGTIDASNRAEGGFAVPLYVLILAMAGGVINMFLKLPDFVHWYHALSSETDPVRERKLVGDFRKSVCTYFVYVLSSPFLALIVYGLLSVFDYTNVWVVGIISASVGFTSSKIVKVLIRFTDDVFKKMAPSAKGEGTKGQ